MMVSLIPAGVLDPVRLKAAEVVAATGDAVTHTWGISAVPDHINRRCVDFMIGNIADGNTVANYLIRNAGRLDVQGIIWNGRVMGFPENGPGYAGPSGRWRPYRGGNPHRDHPHVQFSGAAYRPPAGGAAPGNTTQDYWQKEFGMSKAELANMITNIVRTELRTGAIGPTSAGAYWPSSFANNVGHAASHAMHLDKGGVRAQVNAELFQPAIPGNKDEWGASMRENTSRASYNTRQIRAKLDAMEDTLAEILAAVGDTSKASVQSLLATNFAANLSRLETEVEDWVAADEAGRVAEAVAAAESPVDTADLVDADTFTGDPVEG